MAYLETDDDDDDENSHICGTTDVIQP